MMQRFGGWRGIVVALAIFAGICGASRAEAANTLLSPVPFDWGQAGSTQLPAPVVQIGKDSATGAPCIIGATATCAIPGGIGNVGGKTVSVCVTPTVTASNSYGANYVVGGLLTFANAFTSTGSGILQNVIVTMKDQETSGFTFIPFNSNPSNTTWTDAAAAAINAADVPKIRGPVSLASNIQLASTLVSVQYAYGLGQAFAPGATSLYGVLLTNATLTNQFAGTGDVQVCVKLLDDE